MIGFPQTETHCNKLKEYNINFDRVLFLAEDGDDEREAGKDVTKRMSEKDEMTYEYAAELEIANT